jgi:hypothetical protein
MVLPTLGPSARAHPSRKTERKTRLVSSANSETVCMITRAHAGMHVAGPILTVKFFGKFLRNSTLGGGSVWQ